MLRVTTYPSPSTHPTPAALATASRPDAPPHFAPHAFEATWTIDAPRSAVWAWLNDPATFTQQVWPYRVEFVPGSGDGGASGFAPGVLNVHHGPFLHVPGTLGEIDDGPDGAGRYRDLHYHYGAFVLTMRWIRPTRLQFWIAETDAGTPDACTLRVRLDSVVRPWIVRPWTVAQRVFWSTFPRSARRGARSHIRRQRA